MGNPHITLDDVLYVYRIVPTSGGKLEHRMVGKVLAADGHLHVLADYHGHLRGVEGDLADDQIARRWRAVVRSPYFALATARELRDGERPDLLPVVHGADVPEQDEEEEAAAAPNSAPARRPSKFLYHHPAFDQALPLEFVDGEARLNGHPLSDAELRRIMANAADRSTGARIRYAPDETAAAPAVEPLAKIEPKLAEALGHVRNAVQAGHIDPSVLRALSSEIFVDPMVSGVGNKKAYEDFLSRPRQGVHVRMDGNDFGQINKVHSFEHGNQAIQSMGAAMKGAMEATVGKKNGKLFRIGGDEFHAHVPTHEDAAKFARELRARLERVAPVGGTHALSVSMGFGHDAESADQASIAAKQAKKAAGYAPGKAKTHAHSLVPGREGAVPVSHDQLPLQPPPEVHVPPVQPVPKLTPPPPRAAGAPSHVAA
jgi:GGDEF domain-containing protein